MLKTLTFILLTLCAVNLMAHEVRHEHVCDERKCKYIFDEDDISPDSQYIEVHYNDGGDPPSTYVNAPIEHDGGDPPSAHMENLPVDKD